MENNENPQVKINHNMADLQEGQEYILTMQDQPLLQDGELNTETEQMVNVKLNESHKQDVFLKNKAKVARAKGGNYDTSNIDQHGEVLRPEILDKYDVEEEEKEGMLLNLKSNKIKNKKKITHEEEIRHSGQRVSMKTKKVAMADFEVESETLNFGKNKKFKKGKKRQTKAKRKLQESMRDLLKDSDEENDDLKTREERREEQSKLEQKNYEQLSLKKKNYERAVLKANIKTRKVHELDDEDDEDDIISRNLEKQRKLFQKDSTATNKNKAKGEQALLAIFEESKEEEELQKKDNDFEFVMPKAKTKRMKELKDLGDLGQNNIQTQKDKEEHAKILTNTTSESFTNTKNGMTSVVNVALPSERLQSQAFGLESVVETGEDIQRREAEENKIREEFKNKEITEKELETSKAMEEDNHGRGLGQTLEILRKRDMLKGTATKVGRMKDGKNDRGMEDEDDSGIMLQKVDKYGNQQTTKEAFREFCHAFHGQKPSQNKREKMQKRLLKAQQRSNLVSGENSFFAKALAKNQKKKKQAHMVIDTKPKARIQF